VEGELLPEYVEMLSVLSEEGATFLVVGGYAFGVHHEPRATKDLDVFILATPANARRVIRALERFGAPLFGLGAQDLTTPGNVLQIGVKPRRIDIITAIDGVSFAEAWRSRLMVALEGVPKKVPVIGRSAYIKNKRAIVKKDIANRRPQDRADLQMLERERAAAKRSKRAPR
jgi:hypothetical protein